MRSAKEIQVMMMMMMVVVVMIIVGLVVVLMVKYLMSLGNQKSVCSV